MAAFPCPRCTTDMVPLLKKNTLSLAGLLSTLGFLLGLLLLFFSPIAALLVWIVALLLGLLRGSHHVMHCPKCHNQTRLD